MVWVLMLKVHRAPIPQTRMAPDSIIEALYVLKDVGADFLASRILPLVNQLGLNVAKKLSTTALSQQLPGRLIESRIPQLTNRC